MVASNYSLRFHVMQLYSNYIKIAAIAIINTMAFISLLYMVANTFIACLYVAIATYTYVCHLIHFYIREVTSQSRQSIFIERKLYRLASYILTSKL